MVLVRVPRPVEGSAVTEPPSLLLQRAAELVERQAAHFADYLNAAGDEPDRIGSPVTWWVYDTVDRNAPQRAKRWVETMTPVVAQPLANILRDAAFTLDAHPEYRTHYLSYIALAEAVLGDSKEKA